MEAKKQSVDPMATGVISFLKQWCSDLELPSLRKCDSNEGSSRAEHVGF